MCWTLPEGSSSRSHKMESNCISETSFTARGLAVFTSGTFLWGRLFRDYFGVEFKELFQSLGIILEASADVDALQCLVVSVVGLTQVSRHCLRIVKICNCRREMLLACEENV